MKMQIKVFAANSTDDLERKVNEFLVLVRKDDIIDMKYSASAMAQTLTQGTPDPAAVFSVLIYYWDREEMKIKR
jgi:hypothetical protein